MAEVLPTGSATPACLATVDWNNRVAATRMRLAPIAGTSLLSNNFILCSDLLSVAQRPPVRPGTLWTYALIANYELPTMYDGRWTMDDGRWTMDDGRWTMDDGR